MKWEDAVKKWAHVQVKDGWLCPIAKKRVTQTYTDHSRGGYDNGSFRIVDYNACSLCGDPNFTVGGYLRRLNEQRKKEIEEQ
jgi:hypothetical protein